MIDRAQTIRYCKILSCSKSIFLGCSMLALGRRWRGLLLYANQQAQVHWGEDCEEGVSLVNRPTMLTMLTTLTKMVITMVMARYSLGRIISALLSEENIHYWTSGGSTLGIVRFILLRGLFILWGIFIHHVYTYIFTRNNTGMVVLFPGTMISTSVWKSRSSKDYRFADNYLCQFCVFSSADS